MATGEGGLLLEDAIRAYGDPQLWAAYQAALGRRRAIPRQPSFVGGQARAWRDWHATYTDSTSKAGRDIGAAEYALYKELEQRLQRGVLIATGIRLPVTAESRPELIAPSLWDVLALDAPSNRARSQDLNYCGVRIQAAADGVTPPRGAAGDSKTGVVASATSWPSFPGRTSVMRKVSLEMGRRAREGLLRKTLKAESEELEIWIAHEVPGEQTPTAKTIRNALRSEYNKLKTRNTGPKLIDPE